MPYPGSPLKDDEIRLIRLLPGQWSDEVHCHLFDVHLHNNPQYEALSYVWGSAKVKRYIQLNAQPHATTMNLESALRHLRHVHQEMVLWVDALCINQTDTDERTHQVKLMGGIYKNCRNVVVYLGDELGQTGRVKIAPPIIHFFDDKRDLLLIKTLLQQAIGSNSPDQSRGKQRYSAAGVFSFIRHLSHDQHFSELTLPTEENGQQISATPRMDLFEALRQFMHTPWTPWWSRIWVVQEVAMPRSVTVMYGAVSAPWSMFFRAASKYMQHSSSCCSQTTKSWPRDQLKVLEDFSHRVLDIEKLRAEYMDSINGKRSNIGYENSTLLLPLLRRFRNRRATDPRDKVYALLTLVRNKSGRAGIVPDYTLSEREVFLQATLEAIYASGSLSVLSTELGRKFRNDLPTWVPDWDAPGSYADATRADAIELYNACPGMVNDSTVRPLGENFLSVEGCFIENVVKIGEVMWGDSIESSRSTLRDWWSILGKRLSESNDSTPKQAFWRLLCADVISSERTTEAQPRLRRAMPDDETAYLSWSLFSPRSSIYKSLEYWSSTYWSIIESVIEQSDFLSDSRDEDGLIHIITGEIKVIFREKILPQLVNTVMSDWCWDSGLLGASRQMIEDCFMSLLLSEVDAIDIARKVLKELENLSSKQLESEIFIITRKRRFMMQLQSRFRDNFSVLDRRGYITRMDNAIMSATLSRRLLLTSGGYLCLGPADTKTGDVLAFIKGGNTPFVLREDRQHPRYPPHYFSRVYQIVGDCYIQGLMDNAFRESLEELCGMMLLV